MPTLRSSKRTFHIREYHRVPVHCLMYFSTGDVHGTGTIWNVSLGGWRVDSEVPLERGTMLKLYVMLPDCEHTILVDQAAVCWSRGQEFGLVIRIIHAQDAARLKRFVAARLSSPPLVY